MFALYANVHCDIKTLNQYSLDVLYRNDITTTSENLSNNKSHKDNVLSQTIKLSEPPTEIRSNNVMNTTVAKNAVNNSHKTQNPEKTSQSFNPFTPQK